MDGIAILIVAVYAFFPRKRRTYNRQPVSQPPQYEPLSGGSTQQVAPNIGEPRI